MEYALNKRHVKLVETGLSVGNEGLTKLVMRIDWIFPAGVENFCGQQKENLTSINDRHRPVV